jgi:16S rRNA C967 or C1407 C5-methylase (RsmB/RsmF family)
MPVLQERLLRKALHIVRPGGTVHYSTCSYAPEENEAVVSSVLQDGLAEIVPVGAVGEGGTSLRARSGLTRWEGREFPPELVSTLRFWPQDTISWGFYSALLRRAD